MASPEERLMEWLRDAHAMEEQAEQMLSGLSGRIENYPELKQRIDQHLDETKQQARLIRGCIERRGGSTSGLKDLTGKVVAMAQSVSGLFVGDEIVKGALASYTFENMEIGSYRVLAQTAALVGDDETQRVCEGILAEEEAMAAWLAEHLPVLVQTYLRRERTPGMEAKH